GHAPLTRRQRAWESARAPGNGQPSWAGTPPGRRGRSPAALRFGAGRSARDPPLAGRAGHDPDGDPRTGEGRRWAEQVEHPEPAEASIATLGPEAGDADAGTGSAGTDRDSLPAHRGDE